MCEAHASATLAARREYTGGIRRSACTGGQMRKNFYMLRGKFYSPVALRRHCGPTGRLEHQREFLSL